MGRRKKERNDGRDRGGGRSNLTGRMAMVMVMVITMMRGSRIDDASS